MRQEQRVTEGNTVIVKIAGYKNYTIVYHPNMLANRTIRRVTRS